jgi:tetraacyldisaccharide 4'-kinase
MQRFESIQDGTNRSLLAGAARVGLWLATQPYGAIVSARNWMFDRGWIETKKAGVPVISIGNLTAGGTGKTPTAIFLAKRLREQGIRVAILSRGYKALQDGMNDEAKEVESRLPDVPHLQSPDRTASASVAVEELEMEMLLLDDGFQHRRLGRDLDIVLLDATRPFGYGHLLPLGLLREPRSALRRADMILATRCDQVESQKLAEIRTLVQRINPRAAWIETEHAGVEWYQSSGATLPVDAFRGRRVIAISAIGNPRAFHKTLDSLGVEVAVPLVFPDHHPFSAADIALIEYRIREAQPSVDAIVCTGKDLVKLGTKQIGGVDLWALRIDLKIRTGEEILKEHLERVVRLIPGNGPAAE